MSVISVCSTKGGVGKTTLVMCLADAFARQGGSTAIVDGDPNGHVATWRERADRAEAALADSLAVDEHETIDVIEEELEFQPGAELSDDEGPDEADPDESEPDGAEEPDDELVDEADVSADDQEEDEPDDGPVSTQH